MQGNHGKCRREYKGRLEKDGLNREVSTGMKLGGVGYPFPRSVASNYVYTGKLIFHGIYN